jgi:hypothetical protein
MTTSRVTDTQGARTVTAVMLFTVAFALVGHEIKAVSTKKSATAKAGVLSTGGRILLGGFVATTLLVLLSHAGTGGRQFAVGLASIALVTTALVEGKPVWDAIGNAVSATSTKGATPTGATSPTSST